MPEFTEEPSARMTLAERRAADLDGLAAAEQWGDRRRNGEISDPGSMSVAEWLARNPTAAAAVERQTEVERRAE